MIAGTLGEGYQALYEHGVSAAFHANGPITLEHACEHAAELIYERTVDIARLIQFSQTSLKDKKLNRLILKTLSTALQDFIAKGLIGLGMHETMQLPY